MKVVRSPGEKDYPCLKQHRVPTEERMRVGEDVYCLACLLEPIPRTSGSWFWTGSPHCAELVAYAKSIAIKPLEKLTGRRAQYK